MSDWFLRHSAGIIAVLLVLTVALAGVTGWLVWDDLRQNKKLSGVDRVGPCRTAFKHGGLEAVRKDPECTRQANYIFENICANHPQLHVCRVAGVRTGEVDGSAGDSPSSQPSPGRPGPQAPPGRPVPKPQPQPQPSPPALAPSQNECMVNALGVCIAL